MQKNTFEYILRMQGLADKDIGWILSKLDSNKYIQDQCQYASMIVTKRTANEAINDFILRYFSLNIEGVTYDENINNLFRECIDIKKIWNILEKNLGFICIHLPTSVESAERYLFAYGPNKKCPDIPKSTKWPFNSTKEKNNMSLQNPLERSSLRLIPS